MDIEGNIKNTYLNYCRYYNILNEENALNLVVTQLDVIFNYPSIEFKYGDTDREIYNKMYFSEIFTGLYVDYYIDKFKNNEFEFWKMYYDERMNDIPYENNSLLYLINKNPDNLILYFPYATFNIKGSLMENDAKRISQKLKNLISWLPRQPQTNRIRFVKKYMEDTNGELLIL
ncbi:MAG TPA: hypothetical protein VLZ11_02765 [Flavobacterium sp.]|nr:hypothetical protein [Flavobacterium sp.]